MKCALALACLISVATVTHAQDSPSEVAALRKEVAESRAKLDDLERRLAAIEVQPPPAAAAPAADVPAPAPEVPAPAPGAGGGGKLRLLDISLDGLFAAGT